MPSVWLRSSPTRRLISCTNVCRSRKMLDSSILVRKAYENQTVRMEGTQPAKRIETTMLKRSNRSCRPFFRRYRDGIPLVGQDSIAAERLPLSARGERFIRPAESRRLTHSLPPESHPHLPG